MLVRTNIRFPTSSLPILSFTPTGCAIFCYRDLGIADATNEKVLAHLVKANHAPEKGIGWHHHEAEFHIVIMLRGWARFMYADQETLAQAGDCVHQRPGIVHYLFDHSPDMEYLEIVGPADFTTIDVEGPWPVPDFTPWTCTKAATDACKRLRWAGMRPCQSPANFSQKPKRKAVIASAAKQSRHFSCVVREIASLRSQ